MKINPEVINVIKSSQVQDNTLRLPEGKMERKLYEQVSKLLKEMGGKWSSAKKIFVFQEDVAETLADIIAIGEYTPDRKTFQYFPTPLPLAEQVVSRADIQPGGVLSGTFCRTGEHRPVHAFTALHRIES